jgi:4-hydroxybenzoate polyprenyltransferase
VFEKMNSIYVFGALVIPFVVLALTRNPLLSALSFFPYVMTIVLRYKKYRRKKRSKKT